MPGILPNNMVKITMTWGEGYGPVQFPLKGVCNSDGKIF